MQSPYELLGVSKSATEHEIKMAYFKQAKISHPDLNPNDPRAKDRFQRVAAAYELLKDTSKRRQYDATASNGSWAGMGAGARSGQGGGGTADRHRYQQQQEWWTDSSAQNASYHASDVFRQTMQDYSVIKEAAQEYAEDLREEMQYAYDCLVRGDISGVWNVAKVNYGLIAGVILPLALFLRFPGLAGLVVGFGARAALFGLMWMNRLPWAASWMWRRIVRLAAERVKRRQERRR